VCERDIDVTGYVKSKMAAEVTDVIGRRVLDHAKTLKGILIAGHILDQAASLLSVYRSNTDLMRNKI